MSGLKIVLITSLFSFTAHADADGEGHVHSTGVGDGSSQLRQVASQAPEQMLTGTSFEGAAGEAPKDEPIKLEQPTMAKGNGIRALSVEQRIGRPGEDLPLSNRYIEVRSIPYGE